MWKKLLTYFSLPLLIVVLLLIGQYVPTVNAIAVILLGLTMLGVFVMFVISIWNTIKEKIKK